MNLLAQPRLTSPSIHRTNQLVAHSLSHSHATEQRIPALTYPTLRSLSLPNIFQLLHTFHIPGLATYCTLCVCMRCLEANSTPFRIAVCDCPVALPVRRIASLAICEGEGGGEGG
ncbi:hypothetical protein M758_5G126400 [Ceratodon purpureus]|nr:hypothetical protein M758_5G126400 [Ceratodon purpureus]